jgi:Ser-tRNA(Ala) deacylase AlaX
MLDIVGRGKSHSCGGITRRELLQVGTLSAIGLNLPQFLAAQAGSKGPDDDRSAIMIFNLGAPSQLDLFDMKPDAPREIRGPFKPIDTRGDFQISEILPGHAEVADKFSLVRSCHHTGAAVHDAGWQMLQTGRQPTGDPVDLKIITKKSPEALATMRHSCAHVMARAVMRIKKGVQLAFGPTIDGGFYYDFECEDPLTEDDFPAIEAEMKKIIELDEPFELIERPRGDAIQVCKDLKQDFKVEHIETGLAEDATLSFYQQGEFIDLCRGPHVPSPTSIGAYKLLSIAGAYWKGDQNNKQLQRLYATAFFNG